MGDYGIPCMGGDWTKKATTAELRAVAAVNKRRVDEARDELRVREREQFFALASYGRPPLPPPPQ